MLNIKQHVCSKQHFCRHICINTIIIFANAQGDGRPAKYRWRPLCRKVWLTPTTTVSCSNAAKMRNPLKFAGVPQNPEPISAASGLKFVILWGHVQDILLFKKFFFLIVDTCLSCEGTARQIVQWWRDGNFCVLYFQQAASSTFQTCILKSQYGRTVC